MSYESTVLATAGLKSLWPLDEASGAAIDAKAAHNGTASAEGLTRAQTSLLPSGEGKSCKFDGAKGGFEIANHADLEIADTLSLEFWGSEELTGLEEIAIALGSTNSGNVSFTSTRQLFLGDTGIARVLTATAASNESAHHFVVTKSGATSKLYIDGVEVAGTGENKVLVASNAAKFLGRYSGGLFYKGKMQFAAAYNVALSAATVEEHYAAGLPPPVAQRRKPPLALDVEVETTNGTFRLASDSRKASNRPRGLSFSTQRGDGFGTGSVALSRQIFRDYPDIGLLDTWRFIGQQGDVAYEGRMHSNPRTNDPQQELSVALVGWMSYLKNRKIAPLIVDRRTSSWGGQSTARKAYLAGAGYVPEGLSATTTGQDSGAAGPGITIAIMTLNEAGKEVGELVFFGGGEEIAETIADFYGSGEDANFTDVLTLSKDDIGETGVLSTDQKAKVESLNVAAVATGSGYKYVFASAIYKAALTANVNLLHRWLHPRVIGNHGLTKRGTTPEEGFYLSDIIEYILATYYPKLEWAGQTNTFPVTQQTNHDNPAFGYDIIQGLNDLALWETNVWEGRRFHFEAADLTRNDWQIRTTDPGVTVVFQGDSIENFANGVTTTYTDFSGVKHVLYPPDHEELRDDSESNPANTHGEQLWIDAEVPTPCTEAEALQFGRTRLAEFNRPKRPGTFRIGGGYIEDYAGHFHPGWAVRSSQTLSILDHPAELEPRLVTATSWNDEDKVLEITVDAPSSLLDSIVARQAIQREAAGL